MPAAMDDMHTWDRTTSRKMGWRSVLSSTLGKTVGVSGGTVRGGLAVPHVSVPSCPVQLVPCLPSCLVPFNSIALSFIP